MKRQKGEEGKKAAGESKMKRRESVAEQSKAANVTLDDFALLTTVGQGSFGKVIQVRKKDTGEILAMKILKKVQASALMVLTHSHGCLCRIM
jgi:serine/threonine protein kinase